MSSSLPRERLPAAHIVFQVGEIGDSAYILESGSAEVLSASGQRVAVLETGDIFGEVALLDMLPRTATVRTIEPSSLIRVERELIEALLKRTDPVIRHLLHLLVGRFRHRVGDLMPIANAFGPDTAENNEAAMLTLVLARDLTHALESGHLDLAYQPLIAIGTKKLVGFEALIRWQHPLLGTILPTKMIALAEKTGLIHPLGLWVLQRALRDWPSLRKHCDAAGEGPHSFISVNMSGIELTNPELAEAIAAQLNSTGVSACELKIELTETALIDDLGNARLALGKLAEKGVSIALDDFGTGYSTFGYLDTLPVSCLKIDKSFVQQAMQSPRSKELVQTSVQLARSLKLLTVAEGIEDDATLSLMAQLGCDIAQGYLYSKPMHLNAVSVWVNEARQLGRLT